MGPAMRVAPSLILALTLASPAFAQPKPGPVQDGISEQHRERTRQEAPSVPLQNRDSHLGDARAPGVSGTREWLKEAQDALRRGQMGEANEYLERAATQILTRSTEASRGSEPMRDRNLALIADARGALMRRDQRGAADAIDLAIAGR